MRPRVFRVRLFFCRCPGKRTWKKKRIHCFQCSSGSPEKLGQSDPIHSEGAGARLQNRRSGAGGGEGATHPRKNSPTSNSSTKKLAHEQLIHEKIIHEQLIQGNASVIQQGLTQTNQFTPCLLKENVAEGRASERGEFCVTCACASVPRG